MAAAIIKRCPERAPTSNEQYWFRLPAAPNLGICSRCYHDHLEPTPFVASFELDYDPSNAERFCDFNHPRMLAVLRQALGQNSFDMLQTYMIGRGGIPRCKGGGVTVAADEGFAWFQLTDPSLAGRFGVCHACYEDYIVPSNFVRHFASAPFRQPPGELYECDLGWSFTKKLIPRVSDWNQFVTHGLRRKLLPRCGGLAEVDGSSRSWFKFRASDLDMLWMCEACYDDQISMTVLDQHVYQAQALAPGAKIRCFASKTIPLRVALDQASWKQNFNLFYRAAQVFVRSPPCVEQGMQNAVWYSLNPPAEEFDVCASCYACFFESTGAGNFLVPKRVPQGQTRICNFNLASPRALAYCLKMDEALDRDDPGVFINYARRMSQFPPCPKSDVITNGTWYRHEMFSSCPSCWAEVVDGTRLESAFGSRNEVYAGKLKCDFYSSRVRTLWQEACSKNDLAGFVAFMTRRLEIWQQTYPQIQQGLMMMRINAQRQSTLMLSSTMLHGANNIAAAAGVHGNYGNSQIGWGYDTYAGAEGAAQFNQALGMNTSNGGLIASIMQLETMWKSVE